MIQHGYDRHIRRHLFVVPDDETMLRWSAWLWYWRQGRRVWFGSLFEFRLNKLSLQVHWKKKKKNQKQTFNRLNLRVYKIPVNAHSHKGIAFVICHGQSAENRPDLKPLSRLDLAPFRGGVTVKQQVWAARRCTSVDESPGSAVRPRTSGAPGKRSGGGGQVARLWHSTTLVSNLSSGARESGEQLSAYKTRERGNPRVRSFWFVLSAVTPRVAP